jgi:hypothetical protein
MIAERILGSLCKPPADVTYDDPADPAALA